MKSRGSSRRPSISLADLETPGTGSINTGIELLNLGESSLQNEVSEPFNRQISQKSTRSLSLELISDDNNLKYPQQAQQPMMLENFDYKENVFPASRRKLSFVEELSESEESVQHIYGKPLPTPLQAQETPAEGTTQGGPEGEVSSQEVQTVGGDFSSWVNDFQEFMEWDEDIDYQRTDIGDCNLLWNHKRCCFLCSIFFLFLISICLLLAPRPLDLCIHFTFDDENAIDKVFGDVGNFDLKITNPNYVPVSLHGFAISAYYGGVATVKEVINVERSDYTIGAQRTFKTKNGTYFFTQNSIDVVPLASLDSCSAGYRTDLTYDLVTTFKGCFMSFMCKNSVILKSSYVNHCVEEDGWMCTEFDILG